MKSGFLKKVLKSDDWHSAVGWLSNKVISTNRMIGLGGFDDSTLTVSQGKLCVAEALEIGEAIEKGDTLNLIQELVDYLVVGTYHYYLTEREEFSPPPEYISKSQEVHIKELLEGLHTVQFIGDYEEYTFFVMDLFANLNINHQAAVEEVVFANLSKFPTKAELSSELNKQYLGEVGNCEVAFQIRLLEDEGRYGGVSCEEVVDDNGVTRLVFWSSTEYGKPVRKYLKPVTTKKCDMRKCLVK